MVPYREAAHYTLGVLPLFILMGRFAFEGQYSKALYDLGFNIIGRHLRGGLAMATIFGQSIFAACTGSSVATAAAFAPVAYPEMVRYKYNNTLALGSIAAGGTLGILIPPSICFIVYAMLTGCSVGALFLAGVIPGIMLTALFCLSIWIRCKLHPEYAPLRPKMESVENRPISLFSNIKSTWGILLTIFIVLGGIYAGIFTANEAGAIGTFCTLLLAILSKRMSYKSFVKALVEAMETTAMIFLLITCAFIYGYFLSRARMPQEFVGIVLGMGLGKWSLLFLITIFYFILGCLLDQMAIECLTVPITFPMMTAVGWDPIWYGVFIVLTTEIGLITPPFGMNCFVLSGVTEQPVSDVFSGVWWFVAAAFVAILLIALFPQIALFLPTTMVVK